MLFSYKIQKTAIVVFFSCIILLIIYYTLAIEGVKMPEEPERGILTILGCMAFISALVAPFSKEKTEDEAVKRIRLKTIALFCALVFCYLLFSGFFIYLLKVMDANVPEFMYKQFSLRGVLFLEIGYFIILKLSIFRYLKKER